MCVNIFSTDSSSNWGHCVSEWANILQIEKKNVNKSPLVGNCWPADHWQSVQARSRNYVPTTNPLVAGYLSKGRSDFNSSTLNNNVTELSSLIIPVANIRERVTLFFLFFLIYNFVNETESRRHGDKVGSRTLFKGRVLRSLSSFSFRWVQFSLQYEME